MTLPAYQMPGPLDFSGMTNALARHNDASWKQAQLDNERTRIGFEGERLGIEKQNAQREQEKYLAAHFGGVAQMIQAAPPDQQASMYQRFISADPRFRQNLGKFLPAEMLDDHVAVPRYLMRLAQGYETPQQAAATAQTRAQTTAIYGQEARATEMAPLEREASRARTAGAVGAEGRAAALAPVELGIRRRELTDPQQKVTVIPEGGTAIITDTRNPHPQVIGGGTPKLTDTERKSIADADDAIATHRETLGNLAKLQALSKMSYGGLTAEARATIAAQFGIRAGENTQLLQNQATQLALNQLRATFGGNPTEGERAILMKVQGAASQTDAVRQQIYAEAAEAVRQKLAREEQRSRQLRSRTYYQPGGGGTGVPPQPIMPHGAGPATPAVQPPLPQPLPQIRGDADYDALPSGTRFLDPTGRIRIKP